MNPAADAPAAPTRRFVAVALAEHDLLPPLPRALADAAELAQLLGERHGYDTEVLANPTRDAVQDCLASASLAKADLILYWIGHGRRAPDGALQLLGTKGDRVLANAAELGEWVAQTGAQQVLLLLDTCHSGAGLLESLRLAFATISGRSSIAGYWFGVLAASRAEQEARSGALVQAVRDLLEHGPRVPDARWTPGQPNVQGDDLLSALLTEWAQSPHAAYQSLEPLRYGVALRPMLRNPRFDIGLGAQPVEHLLQAARGGSEVESHFTGRSTALQTMTAWLRAARPGLLVVTGPAGCGKSALLGRMASLSMPQERARLLRAGPLDTALDPGAGSVHAQLALRGTTTEAAAERLARQLGTDPAQGLYGVLALAHERLERGAPLVLLLDGLDEAGEHASLVAQELVAPLARQALVLLATRRLDFGDVSLAALPGVPAQVLDLAQDPAGTLQDVHDYVVLRLRGVAPQMDPSLVAQALSADRSGGATAPFLLARLITSQLRESPLDTSAADWQRTLVTSAQSALEQDLRRVVLARDGQPLPDGARELMAALAWAQGQGFPADDLWPAIATRLSRHGTHYTRDDAYALLGELGRHIVSSVEDGQQVYRIAHQVLVDYLRSTADAAAPLAVAQTVASSWSAWMAAGNAAQAHGYLWGFAWRHMADAGAEGLALLEQLAARERTLFLLDLALGYEAVAEQTLDSGQLDASVAWQQRAVACRRDLQDPRRLTLALFRLALACSMWGDDKAADTAATEAAALAHTLRADPQARELVVGAWFARAMAQLRLNKTDAARRWARELLDFLSAPGEQPSTWLCVAHLCLCIAATAQGDIAAARAHGQQAVQVFDAVTDADTDPALLRELLACSAFAESTVGDGMARGTLGKGTAPPDLGPALRLLAEHQRTGALGSLADIATAKGLLSLARMLLPGPAPMQPDPAELLRQAVALMGADHLQRNADAALMRGAVLTVLAQIEARHDPVSARQHLADAAGILRDGAEGSSFTACQLGECLHLWTQLDAAALAAGTPQDFAALAARESEAVAHLRRVDMPLAAALLVAALTSQSGLQALAGDADGAMATRNEAIERMRALPSADPAWQMTLAALMSDQAGAIVLTRTTETLTLADECIGITEQLPDSRGARFVRAAALANKSAALMRLGRLALARTTLDASERLSEGLSESPKDLPQLAALRANNQLNLASLELQDGHPALARVHALQAEQLLGNPSMQPAFGANATLVQVVLGQAECAGGDVERGSARLQQIVEQVRMLVTHHFPASETLVAQLVLETDRVAPALWPQLEDAMQTQQALCARMRWLRRRAPAQWPALARELHEALQCATGAEQRELRQIARAQRTFDPAAFDAAWQHANAELPAWLHHDGGLEWVVIGWWNTPTWPASRDYLQAHPELLQPSAADILQEMGLDPSRHEAASRHLQLLADAQAQGFEQAYAPVLLQIEMQQWLEHGDPQGHLAAKPALRRAEVGQWLREQPAAEREASAFLSVWELVQRGEDAVAFELLADPAAGVELLTAAWRANDVPRLAALARLVWARTEGAPRRRAALAWAVADALEPSAAAQPAWAEELAGLSPAERPELMAVVTDAMAHHPAAAGALAGLVILLHQAPDAQ